MIQKLFVLILGSVLTINAYSQQNPVEIYASKISTRMKDTLSLTDSQRQKIYTLSKELGEQQKNVWLQYPSSDSLVQRHIQQLENSRDDLYRPVLGEEKYLLYREKKRMLLNNN